MNLKYSALRKQWAKSAAICSRDGRYPRHRTPGSLRKILCDVPLAEMFRFGKALPKLSGGELHSP